MALIADVLFLQIRKQLLRSDKFIGKDNNEYSGRPLVFSDRNEVAIIEKLIKEFKVE